MIIIVQRSDLSRTYTDLEADKVRLYHFELSAETSEKAELIAFLDSRRVYVLEADKWPHGKPMSVTQILQYIAKQTS